VAALVVGPGAVLDAGASTTTLQMRLKGVAADAAFEAVDGSGCIVTDVFVAGQQVRAKNTPVPNGASASVEVTEFDQCTSTALVDASGQASLAAGAFTVDSKLTAASLMASVPVTDIFTSNTFTVDLAVAWTGTGPAVTSKSHVQQKTAGFKIIDNFHGTRREATTNGTVSQGGTPLVSGDALFGEMISANEGTIQVTHS
jgi:hypothetical protein